MENTSEFAGKIYQLVSQLDEYEKQERILERKQVEASPAIAQYAEGIHKGRAEAYQYSLELVCLLFDIDWTSVPDYEDSV